MSRVFLSHSRFDSREAVAGKAWLIEQEDRACAAGTANICSGRRRRRPRCGSWSMSGRLHIDRRRHIDHRPLRQQAEHGADLEEQTSVPAIPSLCATAIVAPTSSTRVGPRSASVSRKLAGQQRPDVASHPGTGPSQSWPTHRGQFRQAATHRRRRGHGPRQRGLIPKAAPRCRRALQHRWRASGHRKGLAPDHGAGRTSFRATPPTTRRSARSDQRNAAGDQQDQDA